MTRFGYILRWRDHTAAAFAALAAAHGIGLIDLAGWLPQGRLAVSGLSGLIIGAAVCGLVYALVLAMLYRRRIVTGPLYRCGETRPAADFGKVYQPGESRLFDHWQYH